MRQGGGAPSFCWHCNKQLQRAPGKGKGLFYFHLVLDPVGTEHRVHGDCLAPALLDGAKFVKEHSEADIERYLCKRVKELGGEVRKVKWIGRRSAPDRLVMLPAYAGCGAGSWPRFAWVELKNPDTIKTFPANAHERAQHREHERMRALNAEVLALGTLEQIDEWLGAPG
jgi:hypothetical protein